MAIFPGMQGKWHLVTLNITKNRGCGCEGHGRGMSIGIAANRCNNSSFDRNGNRIPKLERWTPSYVWYEWPAVAPVAAYGCGGVEE